MGWYEDNPNVYYNPEKFGLEIIGTVSWSAEPYQFNYTLVLIDPFDGRIYYGNDSGCSCPSPFEGFTSREKLTLCDGFADLADYLSTRLDKLLIEAEDNSYYLDNIPRATETKINVLEKLRQHQMNASPFQSDKE